jgi:hypothetical protein
MKRSPSHLAPLLAALCALSAACESDYEKLTDDLKGPGPNKIVDAGKPADTTPAPLPEASTHEAGADSSVDGAAPEAGSAGEGGQDAASSDGGGDGSTSGDGSASDASADGGG